MILFCVIVTVAATITPMLAGVVENIDETAVPAILTTANSDGTQLKTSRLGDVNGDGSVNTADLTAMRRYFVGSSAAVFSGADITCDGDVNTSDLTTLRRLFVGSICIVTFEDTDGTVISEKTVRNGGSVTPPEAPFHEGYVFTGWNGNYKSVNGNTVVTACYERIGVPTFTVGNVTAHPGDTEVCVAVSVSGNPGIIGVTLSVDYDKSVLTLKGAENTSVFDDEIFDYTNPYEFVPGCNFVWDTIDITAEQIKDGEFLILKFDVADTAPSGTYPITVSYIDGDIVKADLEAVYPEIVGGTVTVQ